MKKSDFKFCLIKIGLLKKLAVLLLLYCTTIVNANSTDIQDAVEQLNYLLENNQKNITNGERNKNWYVYVLGGSLENLRYIINETQNSNISDSFLQNLNKELIELNKGENAVYVALTEYMNPLVTPYFDYDIIGETTSLDKMEDYIRDLIGSNNVNLLKSNLVNSLSSFEAYKKEFIKKKEDLIETIYQEANLSNQNNGYKNILMPFSDLSIRQIIQPKGAPSIKKKYYVYSLYVAKVQNEWSREEFQRLYSLSKTQIAGYGRNGIENKLERMIQALTNYPFNKEINVKAINCQELLHEDFYTEIREKLIASGDRVWLQLIENNPCLLSDMYTYQDGLYAEGAEEFEQMLVKVVCYPLYGALAIPAFSIMGPALVEETTRSLIQRYGYKKIQDAGNAIAIDFTMQFTINYYFDPDTNVLSGNDRYKKAFAKTQLDDIASAVLSSLNDFDLPTELVVNCLAGSIDADMEALRNPDNFLANFDFSGCNENMLGYLFLEVVLGKVSNHAASLTRFKNIVVQYPSSVKRGLQELRNDSDMASLATKIENQWDGIAENLSISQDSDLYESVTSFDVTYKKLGTLIDDKVRLLTKEKLFGNQAETFLNSDYVIVETLDNVLTYRRFGGNSDLGGSYVSTSEKLSREELALVKEFNNSMRFEAVIKIPKGEKLAIGKVGPWPIEAPEYMGGADQVIIQMYDYPENVWVQSIKDFKTGKIYSYGDFCLQFSNLCAK